MTRRRFSGAEKVVVTLRWNNVPRSQQTSSAASSIWTLSSTMSSSGWPHELIALRVRDDAHVEQHSVPDFAPRVARGRQARGASELSRWQTGSGAPRRLRHVARTASWPKTLRPLPPRRRSCSRSPAAGQNDRRRSEFVELRWPFTFDYAQGAHRLRVPCVPRADWSSGSCLTSRLLGGCPDTVPLRCRGRASLLPAACHALPRHCPLACRTLPWRPPRRPSYPDLDPFRRERAAVRCGGVGPSRQEDTWTL